MHSPETVAFEIKNPFVKADKHGYRPSLITIWHIDPETDGSDDSCGWFMRCRHIDKALVEKVRRMFESQFKHNYWFDAQGRPRFSTMGIALEMYSHAAWEVFMWKNNGNPTNRARRQRDRFMRKHLAAILSFAENPVDSLYNSINMTYGVEKQEDRIEHFVSVVLSDIMRKIRPWYQHPKWHIHHWEIQFHPWQQLKRRYWDKCSVCGKRGFKSTPFGDWSGTRLWHQECDQSLQKPQSTESL